MASSDSRNHKGCELLHSGSELVREELLCCLEITSDGMPALVQGSLNQMTDESPGSRDHITHASTQPVRCKKGEENRV